MARKPIAVGEFYASTEVELDKQITECFNDKNGPGDLPLSKRTKQVQAIIAPNDKYSLSGPCMAWAYKEIAESDFANIYIIIGQNHTNGTNSVSLEGYETPYGLVRVDKEFATALLEKNSELVADEKTHETEKCIEVQLPFLQFVTKDKMHELKIVPIILGGDIDINKLAVDLKETIVESGKKVVFIISTNFTSYGRDHHYVPFSSNPKEQLYALDRGAIDMIEKLDVEAFTKYYNENMMNIDFAPIATILRTLKHSKVTLEQYYTSADLEEESLYKNAVAYGAIIFN